LETAPEAAPGGPPAPRWHPLARAALYLAAYVFIQIGVVLALSLPALLLGERWFERGGFAGSNEIFLLAIVLSAPPVVGVTLLFVRVLDRRTLASLGARWPAGGRRAAGRQLATVPLGTLAFLGSWLALLLAMPSSLVAVRVRGVSARYAAGPAWWPFSPGLLLVLLALGFLLQAGLEEWVLRGYVYRALKDRWRPWTAALASSLVFALLHAANPGVSALALLNVALAGLVLAGLVERSGSLWSATLAHGVWNFAVACLLSLPISGVGIFHLLDVSVRGDARLTGGEFGPEASLLLTPLGLALATALWWRMLRAGRLHREIGASAPEDGAQQAPLQERHGSIFARYDG
jgi:membrane protease YdiL (CAAX protease family)